MTTSNATMTVLSGRPVTHHHPAAHLRPYREPAGVPQRPEHMQDVRYRFAGLLLGGAIILGGCAQVTPGATQAPYGIEAFSLELAAAGASVRQGEAFAADPLAGDGANLCVDGQQVAVYSFATSDDRLRGQARIDATDPWHVGNAIVEWVGTPRFWARDLIVVGYNGADRTLLTRLTAALGAPFVVGVADSGRGRGQDFGC